MNEFADFRAKTMYILDEDSDRYIKLDDLFNFDITAETNFTFPFQDRHIRINAEAKEITMFVKPTRSARQTTEEEFERIMFEKGDVM